MKPSCWCAGAGGAMASQHHHWSFGHSSPWSACSCFPLAGCWLPVEWLGPCLLSHCCLGHAGSGWQWWAWSHIRLGLGWLPGWCSRPVGPKLAGLGRPLQPDWTPPTMSTLPHTWSPNHLGCWPKQPNSTGHWFWPWDLAPGFGTHGELLCRRRLNGCWSSWAISLGQLLVPVGCGRTPLVECWPGAVAAWCCLWSTPQRQHFLGSCSWQYPIQASWHPWHAHPMHWAWCLLYSLGGTTLGWGPLSLAMPNLLGPWFPSTWPIWCWWAVACHPSAW